jgi:hypothetical protein
VRRFACGYAQRRRGGVVEAETRSPLNQRRSSQPCSHRLWALGRYSGSTAPAFLRALRVEVEQDCQFVSCRFTVHAFHLRELFDSVAPDAETGGELGRFQEALGALRVVGVPGPSGMSGCGAGWAGP